MEEDLKVWQQKRQERDQLSSAMGEYLLKGYRMLDSYCSDCNVSSKFFPDPLEWPCKNGGCVVFC